MVKLIKELQDLAHMFDRYDMGHEVDMVNESIHACAGVAVERREATWESLHELLYGWIPDD